MTVFQLVTLCAAVFNIAIADVFIKKAAEGNHLMAAMATPWMAGALMLYVTQIVALTYFFVKGWDFGSTSILQLVIYAVIVIAAAVFIFGEVMTPMRIAGVGLAVAGVALMHVQ